MKYFILAALFGVTSSMAFADVYVFEGSSARGINKEHKFECHFRGSKEGLRCSAWATVEKERNGKEPTASYKNEEEAKLAIRCNNGFELRDRDAKVDSDHDTLKIIGRDDGDKAVLKIFEDDHHDSDFTDRGKDDELRARLEIEHNGREIDLRGHCELEEKHGGGGRY